jgi:hypothetical protein
MTTNQDATDMGPATPAPNWCLPGAEPSWDKLTDEYGGGAVATWSRSFPSNDPGDDVWIQCEDSISDGRVRRTAPRIHLYESPRDGLTQPEAVELARALMAAAEVMTSAAFAEITD